MERPDWIAAQNRGLRDGGLNAGFVRVEVDKGVKLWLARLDALEMGVDDFDGGERSRTDAFDDFVDRGEGGGLHGAMRESMRGTGEGQAGKGEHS